MILSDPIRIFLTGMPGAGKTYTGNKLAEILKIPSLDLDALLEQQSNSSISELFNELGEFRFRALETHVLKKLLKDPATASFILSTGGGTPCFGNNAALLCRAGVVIWIDAHIEILAQNLLSDTTVRPMFANLSPSQIRIKLKTLSVSRRKFYLHSHLRIDLISRSDKHISDIVDYLHNQISPFDFRKV